MQQHIHHSELRQRVAELEREVSDMRQRLVIAQAEVEQAKASARTAWRLSA
jgi:hypothetical protein